MNLLGVAQERIEPVLGEVLNRIAEHRPSDGHRAAHRAPARLVEAMRYALLSPGKRLRPALVFGGALAVGGELDTVLAGACAVEMAHAYSLVHDDLPILDDDDLRRGQPTCHRAFGEATALLAGDALLTDALAILADGAAMPGRKRPAKGRRLEAVIELTRAIGSAGMVGGQHDDVALADGLGADLEPRTLLSIHRRKTGRLIQASAAIGAILAGAPPREVRLIRRFGADIGLAFQLVDDALDGDGMAALRGEDQALAGAQRLTRRALLRLAEFGPRAEPLRALATSMVERAA